MSRNNLSRHDELRRGDYLMSNNGYFKAIFQDDGNFVIYGWKPIWSSDTASSEAYRLCMQEDCNFVMYRTNGKPMWSTESYNAGSHVCRVSLKDSGHLVLDKAGEELWSSADSTGKKH